MKEDFVKKGKEEMHDFVEKAIEDLLAVLDSNIVYPRNMEGMVIEQRLLAVVKSREQVYVSAMNLIDLIDIGSAKFLGRIIAGLKTTWHELTKITTRNIGGVSNEEKQMSDSHNIEDNFMSAIAQSKELSAKLAFNILERIEKLEMSDEEKTKMMAERYVANTVERYAEN